MSAKKRIAVIGSGNWGSVIAKIVGINVQSSTEFENDIKMYVYEEMIDGKKLTEIINTQHENIKYLAGHKIPPNVAAVADVTAACQGADILIFVLPHQFVSGICKQIAGKIKADSLAISLIKGLDESDKGIDLVSNRIKRELNIPCAVLMGANIAGEVAMENYCEATIGCTDRQQGLMLKRLFQTPYFRLVVVQDVETVELCGALKNIVAVGVGFLDGLGFLDNTRAAVIRLGLMEMVEFCKLLYSNSKIDTFLESCGVADLVTTCYSGRNARIGKEFVLHPGKTIEQLETELLNGQKVQGPPTAHKVYTLLKARNLEEKFPLFTAIHKICAGEMKPAQFIDCLKNHPEHM